MSDTEDSILYNSIHMEVQKSQNSGDREQIRDWQGSGGRGGNGRKGHGEIWGKRSVQYRHYGSGLGPYGLVKILQVIFLYLLNILSYTSVKLILFKMKERMEKDISY